MRLVIIGRTGWLLEAARRLVAQGHEIAAVVTARETTESAATALDFERFAGEISAPFSRSLDPSRADIVTAIAQAPCDLALTMNYPGLFRADFTALFAGGVLNCHGSLLPAYRGNACPNWAILNGESETGLTIHHVEPDQLDTGAIVLQRAFPLGPDTGIGEVYRWYDAAIPEAFVDAVRLVGEGVPAMAQDEARASHAYPRRPEDARLDWRLPARALHRLVLASGKPFAGAFAFLDGGERVTVWRSRLVVPESPIYAVPGQILAVGPDGSLHVMTGDGVLALTEWEGPPASAMSRRARLT